MYTSKTCTLQLKTLKNIIYDLEFIFIEIKQTKKNDLIEKEQKLDFSNSSFNIDFVFLSLKHLYLEPPYMYNIIEQLLY